MRKYFTWRCVRLHALVLVLVPAFLLAGWWQYGVATGGNDLSWVYTIEWPLLAIYAVYVWWKLIHDRSTLFDRLWAAKQRAAADAQGTPLYQIPGWATDKELSQAVRQAAIDKGRAPALIHTVTEALESGGRQPDLAGPDDELVAGGEGRAAHRDFEVVDARVLGVKVTVDEELEELEAYNRYLFDLSWRDPPKRWPSPRLRPLSDVSPQQDGSSFGSSEPREGERPELPAGGTAHEPSQRHG